MKQLFRFSILVLALLLSATATAHNFEVDGIYYKINGNAAAVTFKGAYYNSYDNDYSGSVVIPATVTYNGTTYPVTSIGKYAFYDCTRLTSVDIPNSVTYIGESAFCRCRSLASIDIPNLVTAIGDYVFAACSGLTSIVIPNSVTSIKERTFSYCSGLTSIEISNSVTSIGDETFMACTGLTSIDIPNSVTSIGHQAFYHCTGLTSIDIPNSVTSIGLSAFDGCSGLTSIVLESGNPRYDSRNNCNAIIETAYNILIVGCKNTIIPNSVTAIGDDAFHGCTGLTSIVIPNSVIYIGYEAFHGCTGLTSIVIPNSVTEVGYEAFYQCTGLTDVYCYIADLSRVWSGYKQFYLDGGDYSGRTLHVLPWMADAYRADENWYPYFEKIVEIVPGDVNGDIEVNIADINAVIDTIQGGNGSSSLADVNGDGEINIADINAIIDIILGGTQN